MANPNPFGTEEEIKEKYANADVLLAYQPGQIVIPVLKGSICDVCDKPATTTCEVMTSLCCGTPVCQEHPICVVHGGR